MPARYFNVLLLKSSGLEWREQGGCLLNRDRLFLCGSLWWPGGKRGEDWVHCLVWVCQRKIRLEVWAMWLFLRPQSCCHMGISAMYGLKIRCMASQLKGIRLKYGPLPTRPLVVSNSQIKALSLCLKYFFFMSHVSLSCCVLYNTVYTVYLQ